jgi:hypothetical protein
MVELQAFLLHLTTTFVACWLMYLMVSSPVSNLTLMHLVGIEVPLPHHELCHRMH